MNIRGYIDCVDKDSIAGWAWDKDTPNTPVEIILQALDIEILRVSANRFRPDLLQAGIGDGHHSFVMNLTAVCLPQNIKLYCFVKNSKEPLLFKGKSAFSLEAESDDLFLPAVKDLATISHQLKQMVEKGWGLLDSEEIKTLRQWMKSPFGTHWRRQVPRLVPWCKLMADRFAVLADGRVTTCCADPYGNNSFGHIDEDNVRTIWQRYKMILAGDLWNLPHCRNCENGDFHLVSEGSELENWMKSANRLHPHGFNLELLTQCNYSCELCPSGEHRPLGDYRLDLDRFLIWLGEETAYLQKILLFNYGEPLLHNGIFKLIYALRNKNDHCFFEISTNGMLLNENACKALIESRVNLVTVSAHGAPGTESMLRYSRKGASYEQILKNISTLLTLRKQMGQSVPIVHLKAILFDWNDSDHSLAQLRQDAETLGLFSGRQFDRDGYYWVLDAHKESTDRASKRVVPGNELHKRMKAARELFD